MKKISLIATTAFCVFLLNAASAQTSKPANTSGENSRSTQRPGQPGSNGSGDGVQHNMLNGTGDGLRNSSAPSVYTGGSGEQGALPSVDRRPGAKPDAPKPATDKSSSSTDKAPTGWGTEKKPKM